MKTMAVVVIWLWLLWLASVVLQAVEDWFNRSTKTLAAEVTVSLIVAAVVVLKSDRFVSCWSLLLLSAKFCCAARRLKNC